MHRALLPVRRPAGGARRHLRQPPHQGACEAAALALACRAAAADGARAPLHAIPQTPTPAARHPTTTQIDLINTSGFAMFRVSIDAHLMRVAALDAIAIQT